MKAKKIIFYSLAALAMTACTNDDFNGDSANGDGMSSVMLTMNAGEGNTLAYPLNIYAYDSEGQLATSISVQDESTAAKLNLKKGNYNIAVTSGPTDFSSGYTTVPLSVAKADLVVKSQDVNTNVTMNYAVAAVDFTLSQIPAEVEKMSVTISGLYGAITPKGELSGNVNATVECVKTDDPTVWKTSTVYVLPSISDNVQIGINITNDEGDATYTYTYNAKLKANTPYHFTGTYNYITPVADALFSFNVQDWDDDVNTSFTFTNDGTIPTPSPIDPTPTPTPTPTPGGNKYVDADGILTYVVSSVPAVGTMVDGHFLAGMDEDGGIFLSLVEETSKASGAIALAEAYTENGLSGWYLPTDMEVKTIKSSWNGKGGMPGMLSAIVGFGGKEMAGTKYLCNDAAQYFQWTSSTIAKATTTTTYTLRYIMPVRFVVK